VHPRLKEILAHKRSEVENLRKRGLPDNRRKDFSAVRDFKKATSRPDRIGLIAEIKFASPSAGVIRERTDPCAIGRIYEDTGVSAISLLTDSRFFGGDLNDLPRLKEAVSVPLLRKDFILDEIQVRESFLYGADAILLIARILSREELRTLIAVSKESGLTPLTEIHDRDDLEKAVDCGAEMIGINNRDLDTFEVSLQTTLDLAPLIPQGCIKVSESGIYGKEEIGLLRRGGIQAALVGTSIMKSKDRMAKLRELTYACCQAGETDDKS
jgi:indole-3-glycerol phosphate synthase